MSLVHATIKSDILTVLNQSFANSSDPSNVKSQFADALATAIVNAIQSAQVTIPSGAIVTTGSATTQSNAAPVIVTNGLS